MRNAGLSGVITAIPTPLLENEDADAAALKKIINYAIAEGANGIFVLGNMGEGPALADSQKLLVIEKSVEYVDSRVPLLAGIGDVSPRRMIERGRQAEALKPDFLVFTTPYYYRFPHPRSIYDSSRMIAGELSCPLVFYHCPGATGNRVDFETMCEIMELPGMEAVKDSSCDFSFFSEILRAYPRGKDRPCAILQGDETLYDMSLLGGADGVVTGGGTLFIETLVKLYKAARDKDFAETASLQKKFGKQMGDMLGTEKSIDWMYAVKKELSKKGLCEPNVTTPFLKRMQEEGQRQ